MARVTLTFDVPDALIQAGAIEMFASAFGWTSESVDEDGELISAMDFGINHLRHYMYHHAKKHYVKQIKRQADDMFAQLAIPEIEP